MLSVSSAFSASELLGALRSAGAFGALSALSSASAFSAIGASDSQINENHRQSD